MCYYVATSFSTEDIIQLEHDFVLQWAEDESPLYFCVSGFAHPTLPIITEQKVQAIQWGLVPNWVKDEDTAKKLRVQTLNAQSETVDGKPSFRSAVKASRMGILPVKGFFEWRHHANGKTYPYFIYPTQNRFFYLATIYETWLNPSTQAPLTGFSILTTPANERMQEIHNTKQRMPLILETEAAKQWIDSKLPFEEKQKLIKPFATEGMKDHTISRLITSRKDNPNQPAVLDYCSYPEIENVQGSLF